MKKYILLLAIILSVSTNVYATLNSTQAIDGTVGAQMQVNPSGSEWIVWDGKITVNNPNPLSDTTQIFYNATGALTNYKITPAIATGWSICVEHFSIVSMDATNEGEWKMCWMSDGTQEFEGGWIGKRPSGMGDIIYAVKDGASSPGVWVTTPGACKIIIHYKSSAGGF